MRRPVFAMICRDVRYMANIAFAGKAGINERLKIAPNKTLANIQFGVILPFSKCVNYEMAP